MKVPKILNLSMTSQNLIQELAILDKRLHPFVEAATAAKQANTVLEGAMAEASRPVLQEHMNVKNQLMLSIWNDLCILMQQTLKDEQ